jgi:hypothetical protein
MSSEVEEILIEEDSNKGGFRLRVIAQVRGPGTTTIRYVVRILNPEGESMDYMTTLQGFQSLGEILQALSSFATLPLYANAKDIKELRSLLTAENIKKFAEILEMRRR